MGVVGSTSFIKCVFGITYSRCGQVYASFECLGPVHSQTLMIGIYIVAYASEYVNNQVILNVEISFVLVDIFPTVFAWSSHNCNPF